LRWDTHAANLADKNRHGTSNRGNRHGMSKLTEQQVRQIIYTYRTGLFTQKEIAEQYGICRENISAIVTRKSWKHLWRAQR
jgi:transcriptional regulator